MHPYSIRLLELFLIQKGGYPFGADDLDIEDRIMLGAIDLTLRRRDMMEAFRALSGKVEQKGD